MQTPSRPEPVAAFHQPQDFLTECRAIYDLLAPLADGELARPTLFKSWTITDIIRHLHMWDRATEWSMIDPGAFQAAMADWVAFCRTNDVRDLERQELGHLRPTQLLENWWRFAQKLAARYQTCNPTDRVGWAGPDMSIRSSVTARQMETWAHGQAIFDALGAVRRDTDALHNIATIGVLTYRWSFAVRGLEAPGPAPRIRLTAPSGTVWQWNEGNTESCVSGSAVQFCQTVTQTRNIADTELSVSGDAARQWMAHPQCFAGKSETPPPPGTRYRVEKIGQV